MDTTEMISKKRRFNIKNLHTNSREIIRHNPIIY